jgi:hypothetical protein
MALPIAAKNTDGWLANDRPPLIKDSQQFWIVELVQAYTHSNLK